MTWLQRLAKDLPNPGSVLGALSYALLFFGLAWLLSRLARRALRRAAQRHVPPSREVIFVGQLLQIGIYLLALTLYAHVIPSLRHIGTALLASVGVMSVVLGIAAQHTLGNLIAGVSILLYRPFRIGDSLQVTAPTGLETGIVESMTLGYTVLQTFDNRRIVVPNSLMATQVSVNLSAVDPKTLAVVPFTISYEASVERARAILLELAAGHPDVEGVVACPVTELGTSGVRLDLRAWCRSADATYKVRFDLFEQAKREFAANGIEIALPSMNVRMRPPGLSAS